MNTLTNNESIKSPSFSWGFENPKKNITNNIICILLIFSIGFFCTEVIKADCVPQAQIDIDQSRLDWDIGAAVVADILLTIAIAATYSTAGAAALAIGAASTAAAKAHHDVYLDGKQLAYDKAHACCPNK